MEYNGSLLQLFLVRMKEVVCFVFLITYSIVEKSTISEGCGAQHVSGNVALLKACVTESDHMHAFVARTRRAFPSPGHVRWHTGLAHVTEATRCTPPRKGTPPGRTCRCFTSTLTRTPDAALGRRTRRAGPALSRSVQCRYLLTPH